MPEVTIEKSSAVVLSFDYQNDVMDLVPLARDRNVLAKARAVLEAARATDVTVIHGRIAFREGYPEIAPTSSIAMLKGSGRFLEGTRGADFCEEVAPLPSEIVVTRRRVNTFLDTELATILRAAGARTLVMMGVATGGVILPAVREARDRDYEVILLEDCCANQTEESHRFIIDNLLIGSKIISSAEFIQAIR